jgi:putative Mg2+ transporter-C (MgtC) family protein
VDVEWDIIARLLMAAALGTAIGVEREVADQPAGLRTHIAVALGAGLFGVVSTTGFDEFRTTQSASNIQFDVTRVASLVASGIGFIGAGLIFRQGTAVRNLTTAASIWVAAAIGLSCGVGDFGPAVAATVVVLVTLIVMRVPKAWLRRYVRFNSDDVRIVLLPGEPEQPVIEAIEAVDDLHVERFSIEKEEGAFVVNARVQAAHGRTVRELIAPVARLETVRTLQCGVAPAE